MAILQAIDLFLQSRIVRWALMVTIVIIAALCVYYRFQCYLLTVDNRELKAVNTEYSARIDVQNEAVKKAADEYRAMSIQIEDAKLKLHGLQKQLANRKAEVRQIVLNGTCDQMVQDVLKEVRK